MPNEARAENEAVEKLCFCVAGEAPFTCVVCRLGIGKSTRCWGWVGRECGLEAVPPRDRRVSELWRRMALRPYAHLGTRRAVGGGKEGNEIDSHGGLLFWCSWDGARQPSTVKKEPREDHPLHAWLYKEKGRVKESVR